MVEGGGSDEEIKGRINQIKAEIENTDSDYDREKLQAVSYTHLDVYKRQC